MAKKKENFEIEVHELSLKNKHDEWLDVTIHTEGGGYIELKIETTETFAIESLAELQEVFDKLKAFWPKPEKKK